MLHNNYPQNLSFVPEQDLSHESNGYGLDLSGFGPPRTPQESGLEVHSVPLQENDGEGLEYLEDKPEGNSGYTFFEPTRVEAAIADLRSWDLQNPNADPADNSRSALLAEVKAATMASHTPVDFSAIRAARQERRAQRAKEAAYREAYRKQKEAAANQSEGLHVSDVLAQIALRNEAKTLTITASIPSIQAGMQNRTRGRHAATTPAAPLRRRHARSKK